MNSAFIRHEPCWLSTRCSIVRILVLHEDSFEVQHRIADSAALPAAGSCRTVTRAAMVAEVSCNLTPPYPPSQVVKCTYYKNSKEYYSTISIQCNKILLSTLFNLAGTLTPAVVPTALRIKTCSLTVLHCSLQRAPLNLFHCQC